MANLTDFFQDPGVRASDICHFDGISSFLLCFTYCSTELLSFLGDFVLQFVFLPGSTVTMRIIRQLC